MPLIFRAMTVDGGRPRVGPSARMLGVRVPDDISPDATGVVRPGTGGMSVAPAWRDLPAHRIPARLRHLAPDARGKNEDACWRMGQGPFQAGPLSPDLHLLPDRPGHGVVEPARSMGLDEFQRALAATRDEWEIEER